MSFPKDIRPVLFLFYSLETMANMVLLRFNLTGFYVVYKNRLPLVQELAYFCYLGCLYVFTVLILVAGVNLCTSDQPLIFDEVLRPLISCFVYVICSMLALFDAETDCKVMKAARKPNDSDKSLHPYFNFNHLHSQAMASMVCSVIHMLHFLVAFYGLRFNKDTESDRVILSDYIGLGAEGT